MLLVYSITRFLMEAARDDELPLPTGLTMSQNISVVLLVGGLAFWWLLPRFSKIRPQTTDQRPKT